MPLSVADWLRDRRLLSSASSPRRPTEEMSVHLSRTHPWRRGSVLADGLVGIVAQPAPAVDESISVGFSVTDGTPTYRASGWIYGMAENGTNPPDYLHRDVKFQVMRAGGYDRQNPDGSWYIARLERGGADGLCTNRASGRHQTKGEWWACNFHASQTGKIASVTPSVSYDAFARGHPVPRGFSSEEAARPGTSRSTPSAWTPPAALCRTTGWPSGSTGGVALPTRSPRAEPTDAPGPTAVAAATSNGLRG
jgi:hypothetical protein